jgi:hypothetical protein
VLAHQALLTSKWRHANLIHLLFVLMQEVYVCTVESEAGLQWCS